MKRSNISQKEFQERLTAKCHQSISLVGEYINKRSKVTVQCNECGHIWSFIPQNKMYRPAKFYCPNCGDYQNKKQNIYVKCAYCGKEIRKVQSEINSNTTGNFYCSKVCGNKHKNEVRKNNGEWDIIKNYRVKAFQSYPHKCAVCGWDEDERILEVHHIDENRDNNTVENLCILCPICHRKLTSKHYILIKSDFMIKQIN